MSMPVRRLHAESERWVREGILSSEQAERIRGLYPASRPSRPWATLVFCGLGAVIVGLGVTLLFAYNWRAMPKAAKLATVFLGLGAAHAGGLYLFHRRPRYRALGEALTVGGTMLFGAGIWLVAQVYHIEEHFPTAFLVWGSGAFLLAWAMPSVFQALVSMAALCVWAGSESAGFDTPMHAAVPLLAAGFLPLAYRERSRVLLVCLLAAVGVALASVSAACSQGPVPFLALLALSVLALAAGWLHEGAALFPESAMWYRGLGFTAYLVLVFVLSFGEIAEDLFRELQRHQPWPAPALAYAAAPMALALAAWAALGARQLRAPPERRAAMPPDLWMAPLAMAAAYALAFLGPGGSGLPVAVPFNLILLAHAVSAMAQGARRGEVRAVAVGCVLLIALTAARYTDLFESLLARGAAFLVVGTSLFVEGFLYARGKRLKRGAPCASG